VITGDLDEYAIDAMVQEGVPVDIFAVGTKVGVSADAPYLVTAYKLVEYNGRPLMKLSTAKATLPGPKQVFRQDGPPLGTLALIDPKWPWRCRG
jgi:nicotinate phosphoribosyltransferase